MNASSASGDRTIRHAGSVRRRGGGRVRRRRRGRGRRDGGRRGRSDRAEAKTDTTNKMSSERAVAEGKRGGCGSKRDFVLSSVIVLMSQLCLHAYASPRRISKIGSIVEQLALCGMRLTSATAIAKKREKKQKKRRRRAELGTERNNVSAAGWKR